MRRRPLSRGRTSWVGRTGPRDVIVDRTHCGTGVVDTPEAVDSSTVQTAADGGRAALSVMPDGYALDRSDDSGSSTTKTFCNYRRPATENTEVSQSYIKGAGLGVSLLVVDIRQTTAPRRLGGISLPSSK